MDELYRLRQNFADGEIDRRRFLKGALALGLSVEAARRFVATAVATEPGQGANFLEGREGFPVLRREYIEQGYRDIYDWDKDDPSDMITYTVARLIDAKDEVDAAENWQESCWLAYAYSVVYAESWSLNQSHLRPIDPVYGWGSADFKTGAVQLIDAIFKRPVDDPSIDPINNPLKQYDSYWARAATYMNVDEKKTALAVDDYRTVRNTASLWDQVPRSLRNDFRFEYSDALVHNGDVDTALSVLGRRRPRYDWHRHQWAWCHFIKSRREQARFKKIWRLDLALGYLHHRRRKHVDVRHLALADLLGAACHGQKAVVYGAANQPDVARAQKILARQALRRFRRTYRRHLGVLAEKDHDNFATWTVKGQATKYAPFNPQNSEAMNDLAYWQEGLTVAGMEVGP